MTPEGRVQKKITDQLKADGWFVTKLMQTSTNGIPDVLAVRPGLNLWIEVKTETGKLAPLQVHVINELRKRSQYVIVPYGIKDWELEYKLFKQLFKI